MSSNHSYIYFSDIFNVNQEIKREYNRIVRHEEYLTEKDAKHICWHYGTEEELNEYILMKQKNSMFKHEAELAEKETEKYELLSYALSELKSKHKRDYSILMEYYFSPDKITMSQLAKKHSITKQSICLRLKISYQFLRNYITSNQFSL